MLPLVLILLGFAIVFPLFFMAICWLISLTSGWTRLAKTFRTNEATSGAVLRMQSARIGFAQYKGCLTICVLDTGLRLSVTLPFRFGHPPLLIPWEEISNVKESHFGFRKCISMTVGDPVIAKLLLPAKISQHLP